MSHVGQNPPECFWNEKRALMYLLGLLRRKSHLDMLLKYSMVAAKAEFAERSCQCTSSWKLRWIFYLLTSPKLSLCYTVSEEKFSSWDTVSYQNIRTQSRKHFITGTIADKATGRCSGWVRARCLLKSPDTYQGRYNGLWLRRPWEVSLVKSVFSVAMESQVGKPMRPSLPKQWMGENLNLRIMWRVWIMLT